MAEPTPDDRPDKELTEAEFKQRMWDKYVKPAWEEAYSVPDPDKICSWIPLLAILFVVGIVCVVWVWSAL